MYIYIYIYYTYVQNTNGYYYCAILYYTMLCYIIVYYNIKYTRVAAPVFPRHVVC